MVFFNFYANKQMNKSAITAPTFLAYNVHCNI